MSTIKVNAIRPITDTKITVSSDVAITGSGTTTSGSTTIKGGEIVINGPGGIVIEPNLEISPNQNPNIRITGSLSVSGSVFFTGLIPCTSSNYVLGYNPITGKLCYTASCCTTASQEIHPISIVNTSYYSTGVGSSTSGFSQNGGFFVGYRAGKDATNADASIFMGYSAGQTAISAQGSNFLGYNAGMSATSAYFSNFLGYYAGKNATNAYYSNFIGREAGYEATQAAYSTFIGYKAGKADSANKLEVGANNIIIGTNITLANARKDSINIGGLIFGTGSYNDMGASIAYSGSSMGNVGINEPLPTHNFQVSGTVAFPNLTTTSQNNIVTIDTSTGKLYYTASSAIGGAASHEHPIDISGSNYYSRGAGAPTTNFAGNNGIFIGNNAGAGSTSTYSTFLNYRAGYSASNLWEGSNFVGYYAGAYSDYVGGSTIFGNLAGMYSNGLRMSNVFGTSAGYASIWSQYSNFLGAEAGANTYMAHNTNFLGFQAGSNTSWSFDCNMLGTSAGLNSKNTYYSNFIGNSAGAGVTYTPQSNFIGMNAGNTATNAYLSNFIGNYAGKEAFSASYSNFIGSGAGWGARNASFSTLIGFNIAYKNPIFYPTSIGRNNIIIGTNITLPDNTQDSINLGGIIFATGSHFTNPEVAPTHPYSGSMANARVGITVVQPTARLHIGPSTTAAALMRLEVGPAPDNPNDGDIWLESNTNTGLKIRINGVTKTITLS